MHTDPSAPFRLSAAQVRFFHLFGYLKLPGLFAAEAGQLSDAFNQQFAQRSTDIIHLVHEAHYNRARQILMHFIDSDAWLAGLLADPRIQGIARGLAGEDFCFISSDGNIFNGDTVWHADTYSLIPKHPFFKIAFYLDPMTFDCGAFRVIPGSHFEGDYFARSLHETLPDHRHTLGLPAQAIPCTLIESQPGDVIVFNYRIQHATCDTRYPRRMFHYGISPFIPPALKPAALKMVNELLERFRQPVFTDPLYHHPDRTIQRALAPLKALATEVIRNRPEPQP